MAAVRCLALICDACLWPLLRSIGSDEHILDVLPTMWPQALAFFREAAASPATVLGGSLQLLLSCDREAKLTERAKRGALDIALVRKQVAEEHSERERPRDLAVEDARDEVGAGDALLRVVVKVQHRRQQARHGAERGAERRAADRRQQPPPLFHPPTHPYQYYLSFL